MPTINGTDGDDIIEGTFDPAGETINGLGGNDQINGKTGDDTINGGDGNDTIIHNYYGSIVIDGGNGDDLILVDHRSSYFSNHVGDGSASHVITGGTGRDRVRFSTEYDGTVLIDLGTDNDAVFVLAGFQTITLTLGTGQDRVQIGNFYVDYSPVTALDFATGASGDILDVVSFMIGNPFWDGLSNPFSGGFVLLTQQGADVVVSYDHDGADTFNSPISIFVFKNVTLASLTAFNFGNVDPNGAAITAVNSNGTSGDDMLFGSLLNDTLSGGGGDDTIDGGAGNNTLSGGDGSDVIAAGRGNDVIYGGDGDDFIDDLAGTISIFGEGGNDAITVNGFNSTGTIDGGGGDDTIWFNCVSSQTARNDTILAGAGNDRVFYSGYAQYSAQRAGLIDLGSGNDNLTITVNDFAPRVILGDGTDKITLLDADNSYFVDIADFTPGNLGDIFDFHSYVLESGAILPANGNPFTGFLWARLEQVGADVVLQWDVAGQGFNYQILAVFRNTTVTAFTDYNFGYSLSPPVPAGVDLTAPVDGGTLNGTNWSDTLTGQDGNDILWGLSSADFLRGNGGDDRLYGGSGNDQLFGGDGNDLIVNGLEGISDSDTIDGGAGNDRIVIYSSSGSANGGTGNDVFEVRTVTGALDGGAGTDELQFIGLSSLTTGLRIDLSGFWTSGSGLIGPNNVIFQGFETITGLSGTGGIDHLVLGTGHVGAPLATVNLYAGNDFIDLGDAGDIVNGGAGDDHLVGGSLDNGLRGDSGDDLLEGRGGNDNLDGDAGDDILFGNEGNDGLYGGNGADQLDGGVGDDSLYGMDGDDVLIGGTGADLLAIGAGTDNAHGGDGDDFLRADSGWLSVGDVMDGGAGQDRLHFYLSNEPAGFSFNLTGYWANMSTQIGGAIISNIELFEFDLGSAADHIVIGSDATVGQTLDGQGGDDILVGGGANDTIFGGSGNDMLDGGGGDDVIEGGEGNDLVLFGSGTDNLSDRFGNNTLQASGNGAVLRLRSGGVPDSVTEASSSIVSGFQTISAGGFTNVRLIGTEYFDSIDLTGLTIVGPIIVQGLGGNDWITGTEGSDVIEGNDGNDILVGSGGDDIIDGGEGNDSINGGNGTDAMYGGGGDDTYYADTQADLAFESATGGTDTVIAFSGYYLYASIENLRLVNGAGNIFGVGNGLSNSIQGNNGANLLIAGDGDDVVSGDDGNDSIYGQNGADTLMGGVGIDYLVGGAGDDTLRGGDNADALYGEDGDDYLDGGISFDTDILVGGAGNDTLYAISELGDYDLLDGGAGDDIYWVDTGDDLTFEALNGGIDTVHADIRVPNAGVYLWANVENLILEGTTTFGVGNELDNTITGNASVNLLLGGAGNDTINGRGGNDVLFGEAGNDRFVFTAGTGGDVIGDFTRGQDKIDISAFGFSFAQAQANFIQNGNVGAINLGNGDFIVLHNVTMSTLTAADFIFGGINQTALKGGPPVMEPLGDWGGEARANLFADAIQFASDDLHWHRPQAEAFG